MKLAPRALRHALSTAVALVLGAAMLTSAAPAGAIAAVPTVSVTPAAIDFHDQRVNTFGAARTITVTNSGSTPVHMGDLGSEAGDPDDYALTDATTCVDQNGTGATLTNNGDSCVISLVFFPVNRGSRPLTLEMAPPHLVTTMPTA